MKKILISIIYLLFGVIGYCQEDIPINPDTKMVSVSNVVIVKDTSIIEIKKIADNFITTKSSNIGFGATNRLTKKTITKMPIFYAKKALEQDSIVLYDFQMTIYYPHTFGGMTSDMANDLFDFKLLLYFKKGKFKYDFTNMIHTYHIGMGNGFSGGKFENEKPEKNNQYIFK